jgi:hypothetical protein
LHHVFDFCRICAGSRRRARLGIMSYE